MTYWLFKSEPSEFSIDDLKSAKKAMWEGVRNYQARNFFRDEIKCGDKVLFYHSNTKTPSVVGQMTVASDAYPDPSQFDKKSAYYDAKSEKNDPRWFLVDVAFEEKFENPVTLEYLKSYKKYADMKLTQKGNRLSVMPISKHHFDAIVALGKEK